MDHLLHKMVKTGDEKIQFQTTLKAPRTITKERERKRERNKRRKNQIYGFPFEEHLFLNATLRHVAVHPRLSCFCVCLQTISLPFRHSPIPSTESNWFFNLEEKSSVFLGLSWRSLQSPLASKENVCHGKWKFLPKYTMFFLGDLRSIIKIIRFTSFLKKQISSDY